MSDPLFKLTGITKSYNGRRVLNIPDLEVYRGEIFAVVGPSGAGKSTLLRLLNFIENPTTGTIYFRNHTFGVNDEVPLDVVRRVTTVFQHPVLLNRSVLSNVLYGLKIRRVRARAELALEALGKVGLQHLSRQSARTLSGGEAQRVALARAMVLTPEAILLDEPTANLDPYNVQVFENTIRSMNDELDTTLVLVTHNIFQARRLAHRVSLMINGDIIEIADTETFFSNPQDARTQAFVNGEMIY